MPTYDYKCQECKNVKEIEHKMDCLTALLCPDCLSLGKYVFMTKGFGGGLAIHFKGSGFYETDYKNK